jgi:hypothetical protein
VPLLACPPSLSPPLPVTPQTLETKHFLLPLAIPGTNRPLFSSLFSQDHSASSSYRKSVVREARKSLAGLVPASIKQTCDLITLVSTSHPPLPPHIAPHSICVSCWPERSDCPTVGIMLLCCEIPMNMANLRCVSIFSSLGFWSGREDGIHRRVKTERYLFDMSIYSSLSAHYKKLDLIWVWKIRNSEGCWLLALQSRVQM